MRYTSILALLLLFSCSNPTKEAIIKQLETVDGIRYDLKTNIVELKEMKPITAGDSLKIVYLMRDSLEKLVAKNIRVAHGFNLPVDSAMFRAEMVPAIIDEMISEYEAKPDSILVYPYEVKVKQVVDGIGREFERMVYLRKKPE